MATMSPLRLYRNMLKASKSFADYNFRTYFYAHTKDSFRGLKGLTDKTAVDTKLAQMHEQLGMLQRQSTISQMYASAQCLMDSKRTPGRPTPAQ